MTDLYVLLAQASGSAREILRLFKEGRFPEHEMFEDGVKELCGWVLEIEPQVRSLLEEAEYAKVRGERHDL